MNINITSLTQEIEELEKRIKAISTSHSTLAQIIAVRDSLDQVKACLSELQTTIEENNEQESQEEITALSQRIDVVENDISALQSSLGGTEDDISTIQSELSTINSCIGEHTTTITNLQTTQTSLQTAQTNLQTTQSSQASSINTNTNDIAGLKTRMTTAESNISALTGGVDVGEIDERINNLEQDVIENTFDYLKSTMSMKLLANDREQMSCFYHYLTGENNYIQQEICFHYLPIEDGDLTIRTYQNGQLSDTKNIDLALNNSSITMTFIVHPTEKYQTLQFGFVTTKELIFTEIELTIKGKNTRIVLFDQDLKVECYNNNVWLTKYENGIVKGGKFEKDNISLTEFTQNSPSYFAYYSLRKGSFGPYFKKQDNFTPYSTNTGFCGESSNNYMIVCELSDLSGTKKNDSIFDHRQANKVTLCGPIHGALTYVKNNTMYYRTLFFGGGDVTISLSAFKTKTFFSMFVQDNNLIELEDTFHRMDTLGSILYNEDGYVYLCMGNSIQKESQYVRIAPIGKYCTAYYELDGSINVYINYYNTTKKYNVIIDTTPFVSTYVDIIEDCDCVYETYDNQIIKHTSNGWELGTLEYITTNQ